MPKLYAADFEIYIDSDLDPATGCIDGVPLTSPIEGAEVWIEFSTSETTPHQVDSMRVSKCVSGSFLPAVDQPAGFPTGSNNGIDGSDVIEIDTLLQALGLTGDEIINAAIFGKDSGIAGPVTRLSGLNLATGQLIEQLPIPVPVLALTGIVLLLALFLFTGMRFLQGRATLTTLLVVLSGLVLSGALLAQAARFVADGLIGDWAGYAPAASNPPGSGSPLTDIRQVFFATQSGSMFVRLDVTEIEKYTVGGSLTGLVSGGDVELLLNGSNAQTLTADGDFVFPALLDGAGYAVTVATQPVGQTCSVANGSGMLAGANISNVTVSCVNESYTLGGLLSGLAAGDTVVLQNNGGDDLMLAADGSFTFNTPVTFDDSYDVTVKTQPTAPSETCTVTNGSGKMPANGFNGVSVTCAVDTYTVGGALTGLFGGASVVLQINGSHDQTLTADGSFVFPALADGTGYVVTVATQPTGQSCSVNNGSGTLAGTNISNVNVSCVNKTYDLGGLLTGLAAGDTVVLQNNGGDDLALATDGSFTFNAPVAFGDPYVVTVKTQPGAPSETCTVTNGSGTMPANDVNSVSVTCAVDTFTIGGSLTGLFSGASVVLQINGSHDQTLTADGNFVFPALADATAYTVTVATQPAGQNCTVNNGSGTLAGADISNVSVSCVNKTYTLGGTLSGLVTGFGGNTVVLQNNAGDDLTLSADGSFKFNTKVAYGGPYVVRVKTQPAAPNESCTVSNGSGIMPANDFSGVSVNCPVETPKLTGANPSFGPTVGSYSVELSGRGFLPTGTTVTVGGTDCSAVTVIDPSRLTCTVLPDQDEGTVDIVVTTSAGQSAPLQFDYLNPTLTTQISGTAQATSFHTVQLTGLVATPTTATPTYQWTQTFGEPVTLIGANTPNLSFEAPGVSIGQSLGFRLNTSADGINGRATHVVTISPETVGVDAGPDVQTLTGTPVSFHAVGHSEGGALTWAWTQLEGDAVTINGADSPNATFTAPATDGTLKFEVTVTDPANVTANDQVQVLVSIPPAPKIYNSTRIAASGLDAVSMAVVVEGGMPAGAVIQWNQVAGPAVTLQGAATLNPSFFAPDVQQPTDLEFEVQLFTAQGAGAVTYQTVTVYPRPDTSPLHVDAGRDQTAEAGDTLQLYADVLSGVTAPSYQWTQLSGRPAVLVNADTQNALVQLPAIPDVIDSFSNRLLFEVAVTDGVRRGTDTVEVQLYALRVDASVSDPALLSRGFVLTGDTVHLTSRAQRARAPLTASWTQTAGPAATLTDADRPDASALLPDAGSYTFEVTVTDALGNTDTESVSVLAADPPPPPSVVIPSSSQLMASVTGGSTRTQNPTHEGDSGVTAAVTFGGEAAPPTITWQQTFGPSVTLMPSADGKTVSFDAPLVTVDTLLILEATVDDGVTTVTVPVDYLILDRPVHLSIDRVADSFAGKSSTLHGLADGGKGTLTYQWTQVTNGAPTVTVQDATQSTAHFTAAAAGAYVFELAVSDNLNNSATAQVTAHVRDAPSPSQPPISPVEILFPPPGNWVEGNSAQYVGVIQNLPSGAQVAWTEVLGLVAVTIAPDATDPRRVNLTFPAVTGDTAIQFKVTVTDGGGALLKEAISPRMLVRDHPITVAAQVTGGSSTIRIGDTVHLSASATAASGAVTYQWVLKSGTGALSGANTATPTFVPGAAGTAELEVTATDALANTGKTTVAVTASFKALVFTAPGKEQRDWPADAAASPVALHMTPTGGSGQFRFDYRLQIFSYQFQRWDDHQPGNDLDFVFDVSNPSNPVVTLPVRFFNGAGNANCSGVPCDTVKGRLQTTVTDAASGETSSGTTEITWGGFSTAQQALVTQPPGGADAPPPSCNAKVAGKADREKAYQAALDAGVPVGQYVCNGPPMICEKLFKPDTSKDTKNVYGILHIQNSDWGARNVTRRFGDKQTAIQEWLRGSGSSDRCQNFDFNNIYTLGFECTFAYKAAFDNNAQSGLGCNLAADNRYFSLY